MVDEDSLGSGDKAEAMSYVFKKACSLAVSIKDAPCTDEHIWYKNLLLGILNLTILHYRYVEIGAKQKSVYLTAWSCRNLLELKIITIYVLASAGNAVDFKNDFVIDVKEYWELLGKHQKATHAKLLSAWKDTIPKFEGTKREAMEAGLRRERERGPQTEDVDAEADAYRKVMSEFGIKENAQPKKSGEIAKRISQSEEFQPMFRVCSKIMHSTALSIASSAMRGSLDAVIPLLESTAACELLSIHGLIETHFQQMGVKPPIN